MLLVTTSYKGIISSTTALLSDGVPNTSTIDKHWFKKINPSWIEMGRSENTDGIALGKLETLFLYWSKNSSFCCEDNPLLSTSFKRK